MSPLSIEVDGVVYRRLVHQATSVNDIARC